MPCYGPLTAYRSADVNPETGKRPLVFRKDKSETGVKVTIPCGYCIGCKLERSRQWAMRCMHEMRTTNGGSAFVTLTYDDKCMPAHGSLRKRDLQLFMKRFRKRRPPGVRFYGCGEYGEMTGRPHYHVLFLNTFFSDMRKQSWGLEVLKHETYASAELEALWPYGQSVIGEVTFDSCAYVARYCAKVNGVFDDVFYKDREREFSVMSRNPGLGTKWFEMYGEESYRHDNCIVDARESPLCRFYDEKYKKLHWFDPIKDERNAKRRKNKADNTSGRLRVKEELVIKTLQHFKKGHM